MLKISYNLSLAVYNLDEEISDISTCLVACCFAKKNRGKKLVREQIFTLYNISSSAALFFLSSQSAALFGAEMMKNVSQLTITNKK